MNPGTWQRCRVSGSITFKGDLESIASAMAPLVVVRSGETGGQSKRN